jgi:tetratricopeptide (TPR) repeat protein
MDEAALKELTEELENMGYDVQDAEVWYNLGSELYNSNHLREAETSFHHFACPLNLISFIYREGRINEAEEMHKQANEVIPEFDNYNDDLNELIEDAHEDTGLNSGE